MPEKITLMDLAHYVRDKNKASIFNPALVPLVRNVIENWKIFDPKTANQDFEKIRTKG